MPTAAINETDFKWPKIIRDPIHNVIAFEKKDEFLLDLINCREFQRLRRIKQLGMAEMVFPGANHTRFAHSIGVMQTTKKFLHRLRELGIALDETQRRFVLVAALLHDVGHGPFSHAFEKVTKDSHESRTLEIIRDPSTAINERLCQIDPSFPEQLGMVFDEDWKAPADGEIIPNYLVEIVSSQLDGDRFDYLLRDSLATGTDYGKFDRDWIIEHLYVEPHGDTQRLYVGSKAILAAEAYIFARYHMYRAVYFHKATRAAEVMLALIFKRFKHLITRDSEEGLFKNSLEKFPPVVVRAFQGRIGLQDYLALDDFALSEFFKICKQSDDKILQELGSGLLDRRLYKASEVSAGWEKDQVGDFVLGVNEALRQEGADMDYHFAKDAPGDTPYKPYNPDDDQPATQIYVQDPSGGSVEISSMSAPVAELQKRYSLLRYYYPDRYRSCVQEVAKSVRR